MRGFFRLSHRYLGLLLALPMIVQGVTGAILTIEPMLPDSHALPARGGTSTPVSADAVVAAARLVVPEGMQPTRYIPSASTGAEEVWFAPPRNPGRRGVVTVRVDPTTLTALGAPEAKDGPLEWLRRLHTNFLLADFGGRSIVGWSGVGLLLLSLIGIPIWWPSSGRWGDAFSFSLRARGSRFHRRLHGAVGIWTVVFLVVSSGSGAVLGFPQTIRAALGIPAPVRGEPGPAAASPGDRPPAGEMAGRGRAAVPPETNVLKLDAALALAVAAGPQGSAPRMMMLPANGTGPIRVFLAPPGSEGVARTTVVAVDSRSTRVIGVQDPNTMPTTELSLRWTHDIHFGEGLGLIWRLLTIATGLALPVFAVTGVGMWLYRNLNRRRAGFARRDALSAGE